MDDESKRLMARLDELIARAEDGVFSATEFLTPAEAYRLRAYAVRRGAGDRILLYGGAEGAERTVLCALPDYYLPYTEMEENARRAYCLETAGEELSASVSAILVEGSAYRTLTHRDYLGSVLALGLRRSVVGDIVPLDDHRAVLLVLGHMVDFLCENLSRIGSDKVTVTPYTLPSDFKIERQYEAITDSIASPRLDCVVAALLNLSRERAQDAITEGRVELNYETEEKADRAVKNGDLLSVRGYGKFIVDSVSETNRKGRIRLVARKYV